MLVHIGATEVASAIHNAWYVALEEGMHTSDIYNTSISKQKLGTKEFAEAVIARLGREPSTHAKVQYASPTASNAAPTLPPITIRPAEPKLLVGVDIYVEWRGDNIKLLADAINTIAEQEPLQLQVIAAMGLAVWPNSVANLPLADQWCLRFVPKSTEKVAEYASVISISQKLSAGGFEPQKTENLYVFGDTLGFSQIAGE